MVGSVDWEDYRPWEVGPTHRELNEIALAPASREAGYCLCLHPMSDMINFAGLECKWCGQVVTESDPLRTAEARTLRTEAIKAAFPELVKQP